MDRCSHRRLGRRIESDVQGEQVSQMVAQPIRASARMVPQRIGDLVHHQVGRDETDVPLHVGLPKREGRFGIHFGQIPLRGDGSVYDRRRRSRHRRISFVLSYSLGPCEPPMEPRGHAWSDFSFVVSSGYRERVLTGLAPKPKVPRQLAEETDLRIVHVSRALRELSDRGLVECLTPEVKARGRLYGLTPDGAALLGELNGSSRYVTPTVRESHKEGVVPTIPSSSVLRFLEYLRKTR